MVALHQEESRGTRDRVALTRCATDASDIDFLMDGIDLFHSRPKLRHKRFSASSHIGEPIPSGHRVADNADILVKSDSVVVRASNPATEVPDQSHWRGRRRRIGFRRHLRMPEASAFH